MDCIHQNIRKIIRDLIPEAIEKSSNKIIAYHGTSHDIQKFAFHDGIGEGKDQEGVGIYFTSSEEDAYSYGPNVYKVELDLNKTVPLNKKVSPKEIDFLMKSAGEERLEDVLSNWDENPRIAYKILLDSIMDNDNAHQQFLTAWYEIYRYYPLDYLYNMIKLSYDAIILPRNQGVIHYVVFNPEKVRIIKKVS